MINISVDYSKELKEMFSRMEKPDWQKIYSEFMRRTSMIAKKNMDSQITMDGAAYLPLSAGYRKRKIAEKGNLPILVYTGRLKRAISNPNSGDFDYRINGSSLQYGVNIPYAGYVHKNRPFLIAREGINEEQWKALQEIYINYLQNGEIK